MSPRVVICYRQGVREQTSQPTISPAPETARPIRRTVRVTIRLFLGLVLLLLLLLAYSLCIQLMRRPASTAVERELSEGVVYHRMVLDEETRAVVHVVRVALETPGLTMVVTPGKKEGEHNMLAQTTSDFVKDQGLLVAINGGFFDPFHDRLPWDYYPRRGDPVNVHGQAISDGVVYAHGSSRLPVFCVSPTGQASILMGRCPKGALQGVAGSHRLVVDGTSRSTKRDSVQPRTVVGVSESGNVAWLVVADGRQPMHSEGIKLQRLADLLVELGVEDAMNLDGGGSSAMAFGDGSGSALISAPVHTSIPMRERPVANHLGVRVRLE